MQIFNLNQCNCVLDFDYDDKYLDLVVEPSGSTLATFYDSDKKKIRNEKLLYSQHLLSKYDDIYDILKKGSQTKDFIKFIFKVSEIDNKLESILKKSIIIFNIYTFKVNLINKESLVEKFSHLIGQEIKEAEFLGYFKIPPLVSLRINNFIIDLPDIVCKPAFNVKNEFFTILYDDSLPNTNREALVLKAILRREVK
jgi:hypothetical protein